MKERPILFSAPMVRALLAGTKTQTRRVVKGDVEDVRPPDWYARRRLVHKPTCQRPYCETVDDGELACGGYDLEANGVGSRSPYGKPGDRLWVRETFVYRHKHDRYYYRADSKFDPFAHNGWSPSIHMPRKASRIDIEITGVRVERLHAISEADAKAEGADSLTASQALWKGSASQDGCTRAGYPDAPGNTYDWTARDCFRLLWGAINGPDSWAANPWVWAITFRRLP